MFVSDDVTWRPPGTGIGLRGFGHEDIAESAGVGGVGSRVKLEAVHVLEVEGKGTFATVDFECDVVFAPVCKAGGFEIGNGAVGKSADPAHGVIDCDSAHFLRSLCGEPGTGFGEEGTFFNEGFHEATDFLDLSDEVAAKVDDVRVDVTVGSGAGDFGLEAPDERECRIGNPVLSIPGAVVINPISEVAAFDHFFC